MLQEDERIGSCEVVIHMSATVVGKARFQIPFPSNKMRVQHDERHCHAAFRLCELYRNNLSSNYLHHNRGAWDCANPQPASRGNFFVKFRPNGFSVLLSKKESDALQRFVR